MSIRLTRKTVLYWWRNPRHRHYLPGGKPAWFSIAWRKSMGMGVRCSWLEIGPLELRTVHSAR